MFFRRKPERFLNYPLLEQTNPAEGIVFPGNADYNINIYLSQGEHYEHNDYAGK